MHYTEIIVLDNFYFSIFEFHYFIFSSNNVNNLLCLFMNAQIY